MEEKVLETLKKLGFVTISIDDCHLFEYEGKSYLYSVDESDDSFLSLAIPNIMIAESDDEEEHDDQFAEMLKMECLVNSQVKYVKALIVKEGLWLACEREVYAEEDFEQFLPKTIIRLFRTAEFVRQELDKMHNDQEPETVEDDVADDESTSSQQMDIDKWFDQIDHEPENEDSSFWPLIEDIRSDDEDYDEVLPDYEESLCAETMDNLNNQ